ncbi:MAG TPA: hypothetical protein VF288_08010 [Mycobacteriales bacterium]
MIKKAFAVAAVAATLVGCGGSSTPAAPHDGQQLAPPPATVPPDYTSVAALVAQLKGVATCSPNGPQSEVCTLVTATVNSAQIATVQPFQVKVFATAAETQAYLTYVHGANVTYAQDGSPVREALTGPHWVLMPQVASADLAARLRPYLGGTIFQ